MRTILLAVLFAPLVACGGAGSSPSAGGTGGVAPHGPSGVTSGGGAPATTGSHGAGGKTSSTGAGGAGGKSTTAGAGGATATGSTSTTTTATTAVSSTTGGPASTGCSPDLQSTTDQNGNILMMCPPNEGCDKGVCVPACTAAAAAAGTIGCEFYAPDSPFTSNGLGSSLDGPCYAVFIANAWGQAAHLTVDYGGQAFPISSVAYIPSGVIPSVTYTPVDPVAGLPPGQVAVVFLSHNPAASNGGNPLTCPKPPALAQDAAVSGSGQGTAFHIASDTPVQAYDILPYGGASTYLPSASLLFPSTAWGDNYVATCAQIGLPNALGGTPAQWLLAVGQADNTTLTINSPVTLPGNGVIPDCPAGTPVSFTINHGEILQWIGADPSSAVIKSTSPVMIMTGNTYLGLANDYNDQGGRDAAHQQLPHVKALSNEYVGPSYTTREANGNPESVPYRLTGIVNGTNLTYDPAPPAGAPSTLAQGQVVEFNSTTLFTVSSQSLAFPFSFTEYMPGTWSQSQGDPVDTVGGCSPSATLPCGLGDEEWVVLPPPKQFLQRYIFFTDPTYATTNLTLIREVTASGFKDVELACLGGPVPGWKAVGNKGKYEVANVDLYRGGMGVGNCGVSQHEATSAGPFGVMVWGTDAYSSYAYAAGGNVGNINNVVTNP